MASSKDPLYPNQVALEMAQAQFKEYGKFRAIKYAARRGTMPIHPDSKKGLFCTMFVIAAYQAAALSPFVKMSVKDIGWVSDKHANDKRLTQLNPFGFFDIKQRYKRNVSLKEYTAHIAQLRKDRSPDHQHETYNPSIEAWDEKKGGELSDFNFLEALTPALCVDSKTTMPTALMYSMLKDPTHWEDLGVLHCPKKEFSQSVKEQYKAEREKNQRYAEANRKMEAELIKQIPPLGRH